MSYCSIHGSEDVPGCWECEEDPAERAAREDVERSERDLSHQSSPTNLRVAPETNLDDAGKEQAFEHTPGGQAPPPPAENLVEGGGVQRVTRVPADPPGPPPSDNEPSQGLASNDELEVGAEKPVETAPAKPKRTRKKAE